MAAVGHACSPLAPSLSWAPTRKKRVSSESEAARGSPGSGVIYANSCAGTEELGKVRSARLRRAGELTRRVTH